MLFIKVYRSLHFTASGRYTMTNWLMRLHDIKIKFCNKKCYIYSSIFNIIVMCLSVPPSFQTQPNEVVFPLVKYLNYIVFPKEKFFNYEGKNLPEVTDRDIDDYLGNWYIQKVWGGGKSEVRPILNEKISSAISKEDLSLSRSTVLNDFQTSLYYLLEHKDMKLTAANSFISRKHLFASFCPSFMFTTRF